MSCDEIITLEKLKLYEKYNGDFGRYFGYREQEANPLTEELFDKIGELLKKVHAVKGCLASQGFKEEFHKELDEITDGEKTIAYLFQMTQG